MAGICKNRIASESNDNYHIFLNSVEDIGSILRTAELTPDNTRVICSQSDKDTMRRNLSKLPDGFTISRALDELKPISFYTSTCFEGQDIYDPNGRTFVVSNATKSHTCMDISTSFIQICGRIRGSRYNDEIIYLYSTSRYLNDVTLDEFEQATYRAVAEAENNVKWLNTAPETLKPKMIQSLPYLNEPYIRVADGNMTVDRNLANLDIISYKVVNGIYQSQISMEAELTNNGLQITDNTAYTAPDSIKLMARRKMAFKELFELYCQIIDVQPAFAFEPDYRLALIESQKPLVKEAYTVLGREEVRRMRYHQSNIKREIVKRGNKGDDYKIVKLVNEELPMQIATTREYIEKKLQSIYKSLGINRTAKATDLNDWYETRATTKPINGKAIASLVIVRDKLLRV